MISGISKIISAAALTLMVFTGAQAKPSVSEQDIKTKAKEDTVMTMSRATLLVPRPALEPVKSIDPSSAAPIDTLDTGNPAVKILLMVNHTWKYYKDPSVSSHSEIFNRYWSDEYPNPYKMDLKDLNDDISIWVVDTLKEYHCPYQTKVYSPFGYRHGRRHMGVDLPLKTGTPVAERIVDVPAYLTAFELITPELLLPDSPLFEVEYVSQVPVDIKLLSTCPPRVQGKRGPPSSAVC